MLDVIDTPSPNFNDRKLPVSLIILHYTGMKDGPTALARMCDEDAQVSAHYMVEEDGRIFRLVAEDKRAWHAGVSSWGGKSDINSASVGIEIVNGGHDFGLPDFPQVQIDAVIALTREVMQRHRIKPAQVIGHSDIAPGRKIDPGEVFPWNQLVSAGCALSPADLRPDGLDCEAALKAIGYGLEPGLPAVVEAFQRRYRPASITGIIDDETEALIAGVLAASRT
ncbi:N-acetylmuramoyl-L-alanine amidase [Maricaulis sp.]|uniref:N-acetylmuramoyl-L-alanine amidase n=1 Tax=Maricaulis sp. TaxID=1486257 RepID=UPI0026370B23|nr:N-acetylmuramoyl-L-alanine amidase [Maricaulis sp.]